MNLLWTSYLGKTFFPLHPPPLSLNTHMLRSKATHTLGLSSNRRGERVSLLCAQLSDWMFLPSRTAGMKSLFIPLNTKPYKRENIRSVRLLSWRASTARPGAPGYTAYNKAERTL